MRKFKEFEGEDFTSIERIGSLDLPFGYFIGCNGTVVSLRTSSKVGKLAETPREIKAHVGTNGYMCVTLWYKSKGATAGVARLVAEGFLPKEKGKDLALHSDGNKFNNTLSNIRWGNHSENMADARDHGTIYRPKKFAQRNYTDDQVRAMRRLHSEGMSANKIAKKFEASRSYVSYILRRMLRDDVV
jgi:hypothetical protein